MGKEIKRIIIPDISENYGGVVVLAELSRVLRSLGYDARVLLVKMHPRQYIGTKRYAFQTIKNYFVEFARYIRLKINPNKVIKNFHGVPVYYGHLKGVKLQILPFFNKEKTLVIYPELLYGNPLGAKNVVRWLLYKTTFKDIPGAYSESDLFVCFRDIFNDIDLNPKGMKLHINCFDKDLYQRYNYGERHGKCYIVRKGHDRGDLPAEFDGVVIDDLPEQEKVHVMNECEHCYSYDTQTFYSSIAAICGCKSIIVLEPGKNKLDYQGPDDKPRYGVAFGESAVELEWASSTVPKLIDSLDYTERNKESVQTFIKEIEPFYKIIKR